MSGWQGSSMVTTYASTKAFNTVLGEGMWRELGGKGIDVLVNVAGATLTPNFRAQTPESKWKSAFPSQPEDVARHGLDNMGRGPTTVAGGMNRFVRKLFSLVSRKSAVAFIAKETEHLYQP
jgi:short-subunit dehydrogenase